jgi:hypothetical protein
LQNGVGQIAGRKPVPRLIVRATELGGGRFVMGQAEALPKGDASFDRVPCSLSLLDDERIEAGPDEAKRVTRPGCHVLIATSARVGTAGASPGGGGFTLPVGARQIALRDHLQSRAIRFECKGISVINWHRPFSQCMQDLLQRGIAVIPFEAPGLTEPGILCRLRRSFSSPNIPRGVRGV